MEQWIRDAIFYSNSYFKSREMLTIFLGIVAFYVLVVIPGSYFWLKKRDKLKYLRECIVFVSLLFSFVIFVIGAKTRLTAPTFTYLRLIDETAGGSETVYASLQLPYKGATAIELNPDYDVVMVDMNVGVGSNAGFEGPDGEMRPEGPEGMEDFTGPDGMGQRDNPDGTGERNLKPEINIEENSVISPNYVTLKRQDSPEAWISANIREVSWGYSLVIENGLEDAIISGYLVRGDKAAAIGAVDGPSRDRVQGGAEAFGAISDDCLAGIVSGIEGNCEYVLPFHAAELRLSGALQR